MFRHYAASFFSGFRRRDVAFSAIVAALRGPYEPAAITTFVQSVDYEMRDYKGYTSDQRIAAMVSGLNPRQPWPYPAPPR